MAEDLEAAGDLRPAHSAEQGRGLDVDGGVDEGGGDAFAEVLELVGGFRAGAPLGVQEVHVVDEDQLGASSHSRSHTAPVIWVWLRRSVMGMPRNRANSLTSIFGVAAGGTLMNSTGLLPSWPGCWRASASWKDRPSAIIVVVLPVVAGPEMISRAGAACWRRLTSSSRRTAVKTLSMAGVRMTASSEW